MRTPPLRFTLALILVVASTGALAAQTLTTPPGGANQRSVVTQYLGMISVTIDYNSPDVTSPAGVDRTGQIWGQLVPWGIAANTTFQTIGNKAQILARIGRTEEAMTALDQAIDHPTATVVAVHMAARGLQAQGQMDNANLIFRKNNEKNPGEWPVDFGMARVYSQERDFEKALEHARIALERAPAGPQMQNLEAQIACLEEGENINP